MKFCDTSTGKVYRVAGTVVTQYSGIPRFDGRIIRLWGIQTATTDFKTKSALNSWLEMMNFREEICS
ncbi:hypothetical protein ABK730_19000 [Klebsiella indica]|uniref:hypothetical protein n=1 Tax=Klebsiella TaxID=570 RepID=UPI003750E43B